MNSAVCFLDNIVTRCGTRIAIEDVNGMISYAELRHHSMSVGTAIQEDLNLTFGSHPIVVYLPKSADCVIAFMGILYSANPYVPVDFNIPLSRLEKTIENLQPALIITDEEGQSRLASCNISGTRTALYRDLVNCPPNEALVEKTVAQVIDTDPAYIMYTSGSTGTPKGVVIPHRGIIDYARWVASTFGLDEGSVLGLQSGFHFDNSVFDLYGCLLTGAKLVIVPEVLFMYPTKVPEYLQEKQITCIFWVPTVMISVANSGILSDVNLPDLKTIVFAGEVMPNRALNIWRRACPDSLFANLYGPTEITVDCTCYIVDREFKDSDPLPIGRACLNKRIVILNEANQPTKIGEIGELCVVGSGLALGYWNAPEQTVQVFVQNPLNNLYEERLYRTGDLAYWAEDGLIMYLGRRDSQIKLRGNRIELGEIEVAAKSLTSVENACALFNEEAQEIVLFVQTNEELSLRKLNLELKKLIPSYMLPRQLITMVSFPLTPNGKVDRLSLKARLNNKV